MLTLPPLALYVHIPWCVRKCPYCDFNSHESNNIPEAEYVQALKKDLNNDAIQAQGRKLQSIFFGGGTPSLFSDAAIAEILNHASQLIGFEENIEITLEANPGTFEQTRFQGYRKAGVNRLSIGIQSFSNPHLQALGRIHDRGAAINAATSARKAGFNNINLDLMHGLPNQSQQQALDDIRQAIALEPSHISWYQLTIEANTAFYKQPPPLPSEDCMADIQQAGHNLLEKFGFKQYEVSAYAQAGKQACHNLNYWQFGDYLGIGAGAHGKITLPASGDIVRSAKTRNPKDYLARSNDYTASSQTINREELPLEFLMNSLRLVDGVAAPLFKQRTGLDLHVIEQAWSSLVKDKLMTANPKRLTTTAMGFNYLNTVISRF